MPTITNSKTVHAYANLGNNVNEFNFNINVEFQPTHVILKSFMVDNADAAASDRIFLLKSSIIDNKILYTFLGQMAAMHEPLNLMYKLGQKIINGQYKFQITTITDVLPTNIATFNLFIAFTLEFIEMKEEDLK